MGLDMYLMAERYISEWADDDTELREKLQRLLPEMGSIRTICSEVGYWRKSNQIHNWFVRNVQGGNDDCGRYYVGEDQLQELRDLVEEVLADRSRAEELLPNTAGFFFGSQDYDEFYFQDLENTRDILNRVLAMNRSKLDIVYHSSW